MSTNRLPGKMVDSPLPVPALVFNPMEWVPLLVGLGVLFGGLAQVCQTGWMLLPIVLLAVGSGLAWRGTPSLFLFAIPLALLLDRSGIGPDEWLASLLSGRNPFFYMRRGGNGPDLDTTDLVSLTEWVVIAGGVIVSHSLACRHIAGRNPPFQTGSLARVPGFRPALVGMALPLTVILLVLGVMIAWVFSAMFLENNAFQPRMVQMIRWVLVVGGALVVGLLARIVLGIMEARKLHPDTAAGFLAHSSWAEMGREINTVDRWLVWWRLGRRQRSETRWRRLLMGVRPRPVVRSAKGAQPARDNLNGGAKQ